MQLRQAEGTRPPETSRLAYGLGPRRGRPTSPTRGELGRASPQPPRGESPRHTAADNGPDGVPGAASAR